MTIYSIFDIKISDLSPIELDRLIFSWLKGDQPKTIVTPNPEFILLARQDKEFVQLLNRADLSLPDGVGLEYAVAALTDSFLKNRHTGVDTLERLAGSGASLALVGGQTNIAEQASRQLQKKFLTTNIIVVDPGDISNGGTPSESTIKNLQQAAPAILAVALGQGKQEKFIAKILPHLPSVRIAIGIGGALDMLAGRLPRAPHFMRQIGLEWLWRLLIEPKRWPRIFRAVIVFPAAVVWTTKTEHRFWRACLRVTTILVKRK